MTTKAAIPTTLTALSAKSALTALSAIIGILLLSPGALAGEEEEMTRFTEMARRLCTASADKAVRERMTRDNSTLGLSRVLEKTSSVAGAIKYLKIESLKAPSALLYLNIGRLQEREDLEQEAMASFSKAIEIGGQDKSQLPFSTLAREIRANRSAELGQYEKAVADMTQVINDSDKMIMALIKSDQPMAHYYSFQDLRCRILRGHIYQEAGEHKKALAEAEQLIKKYSYMSDGYQIRSKALLAMGRRSEAIASIKQAIAHGANARLLSDIETNTKNSNYEADYKSISEAMKSSKNRHNLQQQRAELSSKHKHFAAALSDYQDLLKAYPDDEILLVGSGYSYLGLKQYKEAVEAFSKGIVANPRHAAAAYKGRASAYQALNQPEKARQDLLRAKSRD